MSSFIEKAVSGEYFVILRYDENNEIYKQWFGTLEDCEKWLEREWFEGVYFTAYKKL